MVFRMRFSFFASTNGFLPTFCATSRKQNATGRNQKKRGKLPVREVQSAHSRKRGFYSAQMVFMHLQLPFFLSLMVLRSLFSRCYSEPKCKRCVPGNRGKLPTRQFRPAHMVFRMQFSFFSFGKVIFQTFLCWYPKTKCQRVEEKKGVLIFLTQEKIRRGSVLHGVIMCVSVHSKDKHFRQTVEMGELSSRLVKIPKKKAWFWSKLRGVARQNAKSRRDFKKKRRRFTQSRKYLQNGQNFNVSNRGITV